MSERKKATKKATTSAGGPRRPPAARSVADRAAAFKKTRAEHSSEIAEDYVELIAQLIRQHGEARTVDIAQHLGVSHVTVTKTINRLQREGLVRTAPYRSIFLTAQGEKLAQWSEERHQLVVAFLRKLGVPPDDAEHDAEGIEHHLSPASLAAMQRYVEAE